MTLAMYEPSRPVMNALMMLDVAPAPCDACQFAERCRSERLACEAFSLFTADASVVRWRAAPRTPTKARFEAVFG